MRRRIATLIAAGVLLIATFITGAAFWTADPGPDPDRCGLWAQQIAAGGSNAETAQYYFDRYNCQWVPEPTPTPTQVPRSGR